MRYMMMYIQVMLNELHRNYFHHYEGVFCPNIMRRPKLHPASDVLVMGLTQLLFGIVAARMAGHALLRHWVLVWLLLLEVALVM